MLTTCKYLEWMFCYRNTVYNTLVKPSDCSTRILSVYQTQTSSAMMIMRLWVLQRRSMLVRQTLCLASLWDDRRNTTVKQSTEANQTKALTLIVNSNRNSGVIPFIDNHWTKGMIGLRPLVEELADPSFEIQSRILLGELGTRRRGTPSDVQDDGWRE